MTREDAWQESSDSLGRERTRTRLGGGPQPMDLSEVWSSMLHGSQC